MGYKTYFELQLHPCQSPATWQELSGTRFKPAAKALIIIQSSIPAEQLKRVYFDILLTLSLASGDGVKPR